MSCFLHCSDLSQLFIKEKSIVNAVLDQNIVLLKILDTISRSIAAKSHYCVSYEQETSYRQGVIVAKHVSG